MSVTSNDYVCAPDLVAAAREFTHRDGGCVVSICQLLDELSDKVGDQFRVSPDVHKLVDLIETLWADPHIDQVPNAGVIEFACNEKGHWDDEDPSLFLHELSPGAKRGSIRSHQAT